MDRVSLTEVETVELGLDRILVDTKYHSRAAIKELAVNRYATIYRNDSRENTNFNRMPPLDVAEINGSYVLFDGFHRYEALRKAEIEECAIRVHKGHTLAQLPYLAAKNNLLHGLPMSTKDIRKRVFSAYVKSKSNMQGKKYKSYRKIAEDLNAVVSYNTIRNWMRKDFPKIYEAMRVDDDEAEIDFEPLDPDDELVNGALEDIKNISLRFSALKDKERGVEVCTELRETLEGLLQNFPNIEWREDWDEWGYVLEKESNESTAPLSEDYNDF